VAVGEAQTSRAVAPPARSVARRGRPSPAFPPTERPHIAIPSAVNNTRGRIAKRAQAAGLIPQVAIEGVRVSGSGFRV
jgi:hypothetical protein